MKMSNRDILKALPKDVTRVQIVAQNGKVKWKKIGEIQDEDELSLSIEGEPIVMKKKPGRKGKGEKNIKGDPINHVVADLVGRKEDYLETDAVHLIAKEDPESADILHQVMVGLANEAASLAFERMEAERLGEETSAISIRRINALKAIGDTWLKRKEQTKTHLIDLDSHSFKILFSFIVDTFRDSMIESGLRPEMIDTIFTKFSSKIDDSWENEAMTRMKKA